MTRIGYAGHCDDCDKKLYFTRADAKHAVSRYHRGTHVAPYRCPIQEQLWHLGNLSPNVINGNATRGQTYRQEAA